METKKIVQDLSNKLDEKKVSALCLLWIDDDGEHIITAGNPFTNLGLMRYSQSYVENGIFEHHTKPKVTHIVSPDGAPTH